MAALQWLPVALCACALQSLALPAPAPAVTLQDLDAGEGDDTMSVGSYIREVRAAAPQDYHKSYENEGDGEIGYSRKKEGGGKKGYQHFDSYHKAAGDNYEFEKADSFGHDEDEEAGAHSHPQETRAAAPYRSLVPQGGRARVGAPGGRARVVPGGRAKRQPELEEASSSEGGYGRYEDPSSASVEHDDDHQRNKKKKKKSDDDDGGPHHEELKEGASDGNDGTEAHGHDPDDYKLPEKYTWEPEEF